jgi:hypothetical protein
MVRLLTDHFNYKKNRKMKNVIGILLVLTTVLSSCKKTASSPADVNGFWEGKWAYRNDAPEYQMAVVFRSNGTARVLYGYTTDTSGAAYKTENTYNYVGGEVKFSYREGSSTFIHVAKPVGKNMIGTWGTSPSTTDGGKFFLDRK